jgi:hypothetical protein
MHDRAWHCFANHLILYYPYAWILLFSLVSEPVKWTDISEWYSAQLDPFSHPRARSFQSRGSEVFMLKPIDGPREVPSYYYSAILLSVRAV